MSTTGVRRRAEEAGEALLRAYAQILFSRSPRVGALLLAATATVPRQFLCGLLAVGCATLAGLALDLDREAIKEGGFSYNALLLGLAIGAVLPGGAALAIVAFAAAMSVPVTAAMKALMHRAADLPVLSLPFLAVYHTVLAAALALGLRLDEGHADPSALASILPGPLLIFVRGLGAVFALPRADAGLLILAGLAIHSRIATLLAAVGVAFALGLDAIALHFGEPMREVLVYNSAFTAVALGGVWFVASISSFVYGMFGVLVCALFTVGAIGPLGRLGVPVLILPFNLAVLLLLLAARQRAWDRRPKSVDFLSGTPEENLSHYRTRVARFKSLYPVRFHAPFRGRWTCTQGTDGPHTHKGAWRHAFDFEVLGPNGKTFRGDGARAEDFYCFRLPVLAAAAGTVVKVIDEVADNAPGEMDLARNWGNLVMLYHAPGIYSLVAHLARGSVKVYEGQHVRAGDVLGACGSSGRSPVPHLHFQLQGLPQLGAPTIPSELNDVVVSGEPGKEEDRLELAVAPIEQMTIRNLEPEEDVAACLRFRFGESFYLREGGGPSEEILCDVDLYGQQLLRSPARGASMAHLLGEAIFTVYDVVGAGGSTLHVLRAALPRVPLELGPALTWTDFLPARYDRPGALGPLMEMAAPFSASSGIAVRYRLRRDGARVVVEGESVKKDRRGQPIVKSRVDLERGVGPVRAELTIRGVTRVVERTAEVPPIGPPAFATSNAQGASATQ